MRFYRESETSFTLKFSNVTIFFLIYGFLLLFTTPTKFSHFFCSKERKISKQRKRTTRKRRVSQKIERAQKKEWDKNDLSFVLYCSRSYRSIPIGL